MSASIRRLEIDDSDAVHRLHAAAMDDAWSEAAFRQLLLDPLLRGYGVPAADGLDAMLFLRVLPGEAEIYTLAVAPRRRRAGLARALLAQALDEARADGVETVFLEVDARNDAALALYGGLGFEAFGRRAGYYRVGAPGDAPGDALLMRRGLAGSPSPD